MKKITTIFSLLFLMLVSVSCSDEVESSVTLPMETAETEQSAGEMAESLDETSNADDFQEKLAELHEKYKDDPARFDAAAYALHEGIDIEDAVDRFEVMEKAGPFGAELEAAGMDNFAGFWIQHEPDFCLVAAFTENGEESIAPYLQKYPDLADIVKVRQVQYSLNELLSAQEEVSAIVESLGIFAGSGTYVVDNKVEVVVTDISKVEEALDNGTLVIPDCVEIIEGKPIVLE
jgi:chaperonin cofactor prefoldin